MRGNPFRMTFHLQIFRTIPAHAGEPSISRAATVRPRDYPRACGGTRRSWWRRHRRWGLSPRMRGNHPQDQLARSRLRTIPAHAGEPPKRHIRPLMRRDYPRACGGTASSSPVSTAALGLSPRMRGNPRAGPYQQHRVGTIPAHAGEPPSNPSQMLEARDYPRACGGTVRRRTSDFLLAGLSPRMRGNQMALVVLETLGGTIPAHAGEPMCRTPATSPSRDYPRACGGTVGREPTVFALQGLSPRMRGNPIRPFRPRPGRGTIPAHAGEPIAASEAIAKRGDYPRACGGTELEAGMRNALKGLSPRMRGNRRQSAVDTFHRGTIPAHAGEPSEQVNPLVPTWDYPRACGGTGRLDAHSRARKGLSPRMRGNLSVTTWPAPTWGTIPAHAGEPIRAAARASRARDYPRACGGTLIANGFGYKKMGLSPRMRGNRSELRHLTTDTGTIPAHAGEP